MPESKSKEHGSQNERMWSLNKKIEWCEKQLALYEECPEKEKIERYLKWLKS